MAQKTFSCPAVCMLNVPGRLAVACSAFRCGALCVQICCTSGHKQSVTQLWPMTPRPQGSWLS